MNSRSAITVLALLCVISCRKIEPSSMVRVHLGCSSVEANNDMRHSVASLKEFFQRNSIEISFIDKDSLCGYQLKSGIEQKFLRGAMTDIELQNECRAFFQIEGKEQ